MLDMSQTALGDALGITFLNMRLTSETNRGNSRAKSGRPEAALTKVTNFSPTR
jgi:hypothetical protein